MLFIRNLGPQEGVVVVVSISQPFYKLNFLAPLKVWNGGHVCAMLLGYRDEIGSYPEMDSFSHT